jgi:hypothetical protein
MSSLIWIFRKVRDKIGQMPDEEFYKLILFLVYVIGFIVLIMDRYGYI